MGGNTGGPSLWPLDGALGRPQCATITPDLADMGHSRSRCGVGGHLPKLIVAPAVPPVEMRCLRTDAPGVSGLQSALSTSAVSGGGHPLLPH